MKVCFEVRWSRRIHTHNVPQKGVSLGRVRIPKIIPSLPRATTLVSVPVYFPGCNEGWMPSSDPDSGSISIYIRWTFLHRRLIFFFWFHSELISLSKILQCLSSLSALINSKNEIIVDIKQGNKNNLGS